MELTEERLNFVSAAAAEVDRLVISGHDRAAGYAKKPSALAEMTAFPQLLTTAAIVLLHQPLTRDEVARIIPFTPRALVDGLIDNNVEEGVVSEQDGALELTDQGRAAAEGVVALQEAAIADPWSSAGVEVEVVERILAPVVKSALDVDPPRTPSNFKLFAQVCDRPTKEGTVLRLITSVRYWRADAHLHALADADLQPFEAHALNRLWDAHRGIDRAGQGFDRPGSKGVASLESRGFAEQGAITETGIDLRQHVERETDKLTAPIYDPLDELARGQLLAAIRAVPT